MLYKSLIGFYHDGQLFVCVCDVFKNSPDSLEGKKASVATYRMAWEDYCPGVNDRCDDKEGWVESKTGKTCSDIESEKLCATMGINLGRDNTPANEACCVCGGGTPKNSAGGKLSAGAFSDFQRIMESTPGSKKSRNQNCGG